MLSMSGAGTPAEAARRFAGDLGDLRRLVEAGVPARVAADARERFQGLTGIDAPGVVLLVGGLGSNALQAYAAGEWRAMLCVEHLADVEGSLRLTREQAAAWLVHELAHCARYALRRVTPAGDVATWLTTLPLLERLHDEGVACALQCGAFPGEPEHELLALPPRAFDAVTKRRDELVARLAENAPSVGLHAFWSGDETDDLPSRWGYALGLRRAQHALAAGSSWAELLARDA